MLVEADVDDRLVVLLVDARLCIDQIIAANSSQPTHCDRSPGIGRIGDVRENLAAWRGHTRLHVTGQRGLIDQLEFQLGRLAEQFLQRVRILQAGDLHHDACIALADDCRLARTERVDTLAHHFRRAIHRLRYGRIDAVRCRSQNKALAIDNRQVPFAGQAGAIDQRQQQFARAINLRRVVENKTEPAARCGDIADADARFGIAHRGTNRFFHILEPLRGHLVAVRFQQDVAAAGEVEAKIDLRTRQRGRPVEIGSSE